jgi:hypothetical protein
MSSPTYETLIADDPEGLARFIDQLRAAVREQNRHR